MNAIGRRLGLSLFVSLLLAGLVGGQAALWWLDREQRDLMAAQLRDEAASVLAAMVPGTEGPALEQRMLDPAYRKPLSGRYFVVQAGDRQWRSRSLWDSRLALPEQAGVDRRLQPGPDGQRLLRYRAEFRRDGANVTVVVAQDYAPRLAWFRELKQLALLAWVVVLAALALAQQWLVRRGLRPLNRARRQIEQLRGGRRAELDETVAEELVPLVTEINRLQRHTDQQLRRSRHSLGDLGHALKTPLAVLRNACDETLRQRDPALHALLGQQLDDIEANVRRALGRARVAAGSTAATRFDPADLNVLVSTLERAHHRGLIFRVHGADLPPQPVERDDMLEILGNLLDNASKWAAGTVAITLTPINGGLIVTVDDDGPGIPEQSRRAVLERGHRLDQRRAGDGLGLAIVHDTVDAYGGTLTLEDSPLGGLRAIVHLPELSG